MQVSMSGKGPKKRWSPDDDLILEKLYATTDISVLEEILDRSGNCIRQRAAIKEIPKCKKFFSKTQSENGKGRYRGLPAKPKTPPREKKIPVVRLSKESLNLIADMKKKIEVLNAFGLIELANLTSMVIERIKAQELNLDFLTVRDER